MLLEVFQGLHGGHFDFYKLVGNFGIYNIHCVQTEEIKKSKKAKHVNLPCFIRKVGMSGDLVMSGLKQSNRVYIAGWLG